MKHAAMAVLLASLFLTAGCASSRPVGQCEESVPELFTKIEIGMDRRWVENLLGKPGVSALSEGQVTWYLPPPLLAASQNPCAPGSIGIVYDHNGKVTKKELNPQIPR